MILTVALYVAGLEAAVSEFIEPQRPAHISREIKATCNPSNIYSIDIIQSDVRGTPSNIVQAYHNSEKVDITSLQLKPTDLHTPQIINAEPFRCFGTNGESGILWYLTTYHVGPDAGTGRVFATVTKKGIGWTMAFGEHPPVAP